MKCFYHNDADGKCSAFWVKYYLGSILKIDFIEMDYTKEFPINSIEQDEEIWIVDYSIDPYFMDLMMLLKSSNKPFCSISIFKIHNIPVSYEFGKPWCLFNHPWF